MLAPVEREPRAFIAPAREALLALQQGPSPDERARGFLPTFPLGTWPRSVAVRGGMATVDLAGGEPLDFQGEPCAERAERRCRG